MPAASVDEIVSALTAGTNAVVVVEAGRPAGVVTRSDLLEYLAQPWRARRARATQLRRPRPGWGPPATLYCQFYAAEA